MRIANCPPPLKVSEDENSERGGGRKNTSTLKCRLGGTGEGYFVVLLSQETDRCFLKFPGARGQCRLKGGGKKRVDIGKIFDPIRKELKQKEIVLTIQKSTEKKTEGFIGCQWNREVEQRQQEDTDEWVNIPIESEETWFSIEIIDAGAVNNQANRKVRDIDLLFLPNGIKYVLRGYRYWEYFPYLQDDGRVALQISAREWILIGGRK